MILLGSSAWLLKEEGRVFQAEGSGCGDPCGKSE